MRELALQDAGLAVALLDHSSRLAVVLNMRLDERTFENARQRLAAILPSTGRRSSTRPIRLRSAPTWRDDGYSRVMMYRTARAARRGLVKRERSGGIKIQTRRGWPVWSRLPSAVLGDLRGLPVPFAGMASADSSSTNAVRTDVLGKPSGC